LNLRERFGCFFLAIGAVLLLLYVPPLVRAFQRNPATVPMIWLVIAAGSILFLWAGVRLYISARKNAPSQKPPSLGARIIRRWRSDDSEKDDD
jgi:cytochrome c oxidase assembly factor CtaG